MTILAWFLVAVATLLFAYLMYAMARAERF
jgi:K+-transporting ATPase KdpF subunit